IGVDAIPEDAKKSGIFAGNDLGILGNVEVLPTTDEVEAFLNENSQIKNWKNDNNKELIYKKAKEFLSENDVISAWKTIFATKI
ncbi:MAG: flavin reductase family protein, partial [Myroides sp.]